MIGAGSAMGPFPKLLEMGATVVAIDIPGAWGKGGKRPAKEPTRKVSESEKKRAWVAPEVFANPAVRRRLLGMLLGLFLGLALGWWLGVSMRQQLRTRAYSV